jgi:hypothetical protein
LSQATVKEKERKMAKKQVSDKADVAEKQVRTSIESFLPAYLAAVKAKTSLEDFAASIGVKPLTVSQRVAKLRKDGLDVPTISGGERASVLDRAASILAQFNAENG